VVKMEFQCCLTVWKVLPVLLQYFVLSSVLLVLEALNFMALLALFMCVKKLSNSVSECSKMIRMSSIKHVCILSSMFFSNLPMKVLA